MEEPGEAGSFDGNGRLFPSGSLILGKRGSEPMDQ